MDYDTDNVNVEITAGDGADGTNTKKPAKRGGTSAKKTTTKAGTKTNSGTLAKKATRKSPAKSPKGGVVDGADNKKCACPLCSQEFTPADGYSPTEHLTKGLITVFSEMQLKAEQDISIENPLPCPRCGQYRMLPKVHRNSLNRHEQIYVCTKTVVMTLWRNIRAYAVPPFSTVLYAPTMLMTYTACCQTNINALLAGRLL